MEGSRSFFRCPSCNVRARKLYYLDVQFHCRKCHNLGYQSQLQCLSLRYKRKVEKAKEKLVNNVFGGSCLTEGWRSNLGRILANKDERFKLSSDVDRSLVDFARAFLEK